MQTRMTLLTIDDDPTDVEILKLMAAQIPEWMTEIRHAGDWASAQECLRAADISVILVDYQMGPLRGRDMIRSLRDAGDDRPIVLLTGHGDEAVATEAMRVGSDDYLSKNRLTPDLLRMSITTAQAAFRHRRERAQLAEELRQAQRMEVIATLAGGIAHDFNNMLTGITGNLDLLELAHPQVGAELGKARSLCRQMRDSIQRLLGFSRVEASGLKDLELGPMLRNSVQALPQSLPRGIRLDLEIPDAPLRINGTRNSLHQVLEILAINAAEAMDGQGTITFRLGQTNVPAPLAAEHAGMSPGPHAVLEVVDQGRGIAPQVKEQLFDPFFTTKTLSAHKSTGLSLALAWQTIRNHGGLIQVESEAGHGTVFRILLPLISAAEQPRYEKPQLPRGRETLLLVDDEPLLLQVITELLSQLGYRVLTASDGEMALTTYGEFRPEIALVILDLSMPRMDGRQCFLHLRDTDPGVKVLFSSGHAMDDLMPELRALGAKGFLQKPYQFVDLAQRVRAVIDG